MIDRDLGYEELLARLQALERENAELRGRLGIGGSAPRSQDLPPMDRKPAEPARPAAQCDRGPAEPARLSVEAVHKYSSPQEKIALFRSLFRGREDVFALRWQSAKTGKSGYSPSCGNEWKPGVCLKPKGRCSDCEHRELLPLRELTAISEARTSLVEMSSAFIRFCRMIPAASLPWTSTTRAGRRTLP